MYSRVGSQRELAFELGISHQKVGRLLRIGESGGYKPDSAILKDFFFTQAIDEAFKDHIAKSRKQARVDDLPFTPDVPIFAARMAHKDGIPGDRVEAKHLHWVSDRLRNAWIKKQHPSGKYVNISVGSVVNLKDYNRLANAINKNKFRDSERLANAKSIFYELELGHMISRIQTKYTRFDKGLPVSMILDDVNNKLQQKHAPAVDEPGTVLADRVLFQVETRNGKDDKFRKSHPFKKSISKQTRRAKQRFKRR